MDALLWLAVAVPALGAVATLLVPGRLAGPVAVGSAVLAALPAWALLAAAGAGESATSALTWLPAADLEAGLRLDGLSAAMTVTVATVGLVVLVYATGYFAQHPRARSALAGLLAFLAAMQGLVLAGDFLTLLVFWELVGALSARLIAFSREDPLAAGGAVRAFLTTRAADVGLYLAVIALFAATGDLAFASERPEGALGALVGLGLVVAAIGKSAQAPLQTWLSGAMAGPTPVSALLHSATMVAAGVYLLARSSDLLAGWPLEVAGWVGAVTAVAGAAIALAQDDLKRVLAGSTSSQLGFMFVGVAAGGPAVGIFHLVAHAAGKATMFLAAGIFQHARGTTSLTALAGAGRADRKAFAAFAIGAASIAAVPPLAAFWSKDAILLVAEENLAWLVLGVLAAAGSAAYLLRPALVLWRGTPVGRPRRAGRPAMLAGAGTLAAASLALGFAGAPLADLIGGEAPGSSPLSVGLSVGALVAGVVGLLVAQRLPRRRAEPARDRPAHGRFSQGLAALAREQLGTTAALRALVERPLLRAAIAADVVDRNRLDAAVDGTARGGLALAAASDRVERLGIDAAVDGTARAIGRGGQQSTRLQSGRLHEYLRDTVLGAAAVAFILVLTAVL